MNLLEQITAISAPIVKHYHDDIAVHDARALAEFKFGPGQSQIAFASEPTEQGNQLVIPGCEKDRTRGPKQMDFF